MTLRGYVGQVAEVRPILAAMERRGLPVDESVRARLGEEFDAAARELVSELMQRFPAEAKKIEWYKTVPPEVRGDEEGADHLQLRQEPDEADDEGNTRAGKWYRYERRDCRVQLDNAGVPCLLLEDRLELVTKAELKLLEGEPVPTYLPRWCCVWEFNPNSSQQLLAYMKAKGHPVPKSREEDEEGRQKETTGKKELVRLVRRVGDGFYLKVIEYRELVKMKGTYVEGFRPHADGRVHTTFTFDTAIGQLSSRNPNIQNFVKHGRLATATRRMIAAEPGSLLVEWDYKSCHIITLGYLAGDANYMRCGRIDMHSLVTGHKLGWWSLPALLARETDEELKARCRLLKANATAKHIRDARMKHAILGIGNGLKKRGLYQKHMEDFTSEREAGEFLAVAETLFPAVFRWHEQQKKRAHAERRIRTAYGHQRRFYEVYRWDWKRAGWGHGDQAEEAVAYELANIAFGYIREHLKLLAEAGLDERWGLCNNIHDSLIFVVPEAQLAQHVAEVYPVLLRPSEVLRGPMAPEGLVIDAECNAGRDWSEMHEVAIHATKAETMVEA